MGVTSVFGVVRHADDVADAARHADEAVDAARGTRGIDDVADAGRSSRAAAGDAAPPRGRAEAPGGPRVPEAPGRPRGDEPTVPGRPRGDEPTLPGRPRGDEPTLPGRPRGDEPALPGRPRGDEPPSRGDVPPSRAPATSPDELETFARDNADRVDFVSPQVHQYRWEQLHGVDRSVSDPPRMDPAPPAYRRPTPYGDRMSVDFDRLPRQDLVDDILERQGTRGGEWVPPREATRPEAPVPRGEEQPPGIPPTRPGEEPPLVPSTRPGEDLPPPHGEGPSARHPTASRDEVEAFGRDNPHGVDLVSPQIHQHRWEQLHGVDRSVSDPPRMDPAPTAYRRPTPYGDRMSVDGDRLAREAPDLLEDILRRQQSGN
jgi:hypothetical protein